MQLLQATIQMFSHISLKIPFNENLFLLVNQNESFVHTRRSKRELTAAKRCHGQVMEKEPQEQFKLPSQPGLAVQASPGMEGPARGGDFARSSDQQ